MEKAMNANGKMRDGGSRQIEGPDNPTSQLLPTSRNKS
jgi:hypothetical protein